METALTEYEFCPSCGAGVEKLNSRTGFCAKCSFRVTGKRECGNCGREFIPYQNSRNLCQSCQNLRWLERNADAIERVMVHHNSSDVAKAIQLVYDDNRPRCAMCGDKLKHGTKGRTIFCGKKDACRRAAIRFRNYKKRNNLSEEDALERALHGSRTSK